MPSIKSKALRQLLLQFRMAQVSNEKPDLEIDDIIEAKNAARMTRRQFVGDVVKASLLTGLIGTRMFEGDEAAASVASESAGNAPGSPAQKNRVVIIGAGIAGLNAAYQLRKAGIPSTIYEGSHRCGGRILTHRNDALRMGIAPEFGADYIDSNHKDMLGLVREFKLELTNEYEESRTAGLVHETFFFDGRHLSEKEIVAEFKTIAPTIAKDAVGLGKNYDTAAARVLDNTTLKDYIDRLACKQWLKDLLTSAYLAEYGLDTSEQSAINMLSMIGTETSGDFKVFGDSDEKYRITRGNSALIEKLSEVLEQSIQLRHMLTAISDRSGHTVLSFKDHADVPADYVVITIPFTMLRDVKLDLRDMTDAKRTAIRELGYGQNNKLFLGYSNRPWREGGNKFYGYLFHKDIHDGWDAGAIKPIPSGKGAYCCFLGGSDSIGLAKVAVKSPYAPPSHVWKTDLPQSAIDKYVARVDEVFPGSRKTYVGHHVFACWSSYPFVKGSYTCPRPGQWNGALRHTSEPIGNVYFAGEHCSGKFQGFMNGAAETGRVAAEQIVAKIAKSR